MTYSDKVKALELLIGLKDKCINELEIRVRYYRNKAEESEEKVKKLAKDYGRLKVSLGGEFKMSQSSWDEEIMAKIGAFEREVITSKLGPVLTAGIIKTCCKVLAHLATPDEIVNGLRAVEDKGPLIVTYDYDDDDDDYDEEFFAKLLL